MKIADIGDRHFGRVLSRDRDSTAPRFAGFCAQANDIAS